VALARCIVLIFSLEKLTLTIIFLHRILSESLRDGLFLVFFVIAFILLIACVLFVAVVVLSGD